MLLLRGNWLLYVRKKSNDGMTFALDFRTCIKSV